MKKVRLLKKIVIFCLALLLLSPRFEILAYDCIYEEHHFVIETHVPATHDEDGFIIWVCSSCGVTFEEFLRAIGHMWSEWQVVTAPTCVDTGRERRVCDIGIGTPHYEYRDLPALGHDFVETFVEATCTEAGIRILTCDRCGEIREEPYGEVLGHDFQETFLRSATCTVDGERILTCTGCGLRETETLLASGHDFGDWIIEREPQTGQEGLRFRACSYCGERIYEYIESLPTVEEPPVVEEASPVEEPISPPVEYVSVVYEYPSGFGLREALLIAGGIGTATYLGFLLFYEVAFLAWNRKRVREIWQGRRREKSGVDGYK